MLFDPTTNLANDLTVEFINDVLISDLNRVIINLKDYGGMDRRGVREAQELVEGALKESYTALSQTSNANKRVNALISCRGKIENAYLQLEHLNEKGRRWVGSGNPPFTIGQKPTPIVTSKAKEPSINIRQGVESNNKVTPPNKKKKPSTKVVRGAESVVDVTPSEKKKKQTKLEFEKTQIFTLTRLAGTDLLISIIPIAGE